jgi:rhamnosyltransferase
MSAPSVCAIFVTYNPPPTFIENIASAGAQVDHVVVIDNGSSRKTEELLKELETSPDRDVIRNDQNLGIAAALNLGVKKAIESGFDWIATFDQDSRVSDGFISQMLERYSQTGHPEDVAVISPSYVDRETGTPVRLRRSGDGKILTTMTSGSMIPSDVFCKIGLFDESLFIDAVDTEFCLRARRTGMQLLQSPAVLYHSLGRTTYHYIAGARFGATNHSPARRYYITRNRWRLLVAYAGDWPWVWREYRSMIVETVKIMLVEQDKWRKLRATVAGTVDALRGKVGKQVEL